MKRLLPLLVIISFVCGCNLIPKEVNKQYGEYTPPGEYIPSGMYVPPASRGNVTHIVIVQDLNLEDENHISFKLINFYNVSRECWGVLEIKDNNTMINEVQEYVGVIEPNGNMTGIIEFRMPIGTISLNVVPKCKNVENESYQSE